MEATLAHVDGSGTRRMGEGFVASADRYGSGILMFRGEEISMNHARLIKMTAGDTTSESSNISAYQVPQP